MRLQVCVYSCCTARHQDRFYSMFQVNAALILSAQWQRSPDFVLYCTSKAHKLHEKLKCSDTTCKMSAKTVRCCLHAVPWNRDRGIISWLTGLKEERKETKHLFIFSEINTHRWTSNGRLNETMWDTLRGNQTFFLKRAKSEFLADSQWKQTLDLKLLHHWNKTIKHFRKMWWSKKVKCHRWDAA